MQTIIVLIACLSLLALLLAYVHLRSQREQQGLQALRRRKQESVAQRLESIAAQHGLVRTCVDVDGRGALGLDARADALVVARPSDAGLELHAVEARDLVGAEVTEHLTAHTPGGKAPTEPRVHAVELKVFLADVDHPVQVIGFLGGATTFGSDAHASARAEAFRWEGAIRALVHTARAASSDPAGRIAALEQAAREGVLSDKDVQREKARTLADRYLRARGQAVDDLAGRQVRPAGRLAEPSR